MVEHLEPVFELILAMVLAWPDDACPICRYFDCETPDLDDELPDEPLLADSTATMFV